MERFQAGDAGSDLKRKRQALQRQESLSRADGPEQQGLLSGAKTEHQTAHASIGLATDPPVGATVRVRKWSQSVVQPWQSTRDARAPRVLSGFCMPTSCFSFWPSPSPGPAHGPPDAVLMALPTNNTGSKLRCRAASLAVCEGHLRCGRRGRGPSPRPAHEERALQEGCGLRVGLLF